MSSPSSSSENVVAQKVAHPSHPVFAFILPPLTTRLLNPKYDQCLADLIVKSGIGFSAGVVASVLLFRRRGWPVALGTGFGAGTAYADCDRSFNPARIPGTRILPPRLAANANATPAESKQ
ncbi:hypothetical protein BOTBODRAFT_117496 [Botryobasidium botryosum FD-172 SS1]|uniref:MICOS complex subunit MIC10 n=1 Tax=Botryobasidium botryosum (strain FD-172 SS1) TaxID=930990 RepID=A0A067M0Y7_BOTB1|nr:hypothetical protein BOTBODRAFT_117496 [Botryobasidium botryosum FD-172 SS1]